MFYWESFVINKKMLHVNKENSQIFLCERNVQIIPDPDPELHKFSLLKHLFILGSAEKNRKKI